MYAGCVEKKKRKTLGQTQNLPPPLASTTKGRTQSRSPELHTTRSLLHSPFLLFHRVQRHTHTTAHKQRRPIAAEAVIRKKKNSQEWLQSFKPFLSTDTVREEWARGGTVESIRPPTNQSTALPSSVPVPPGTTTATTNTTSKRYWQTGRAGGA